MKRPLLTTFSMVLCACAFAESGAKLPEGAPEDAVARVGDETITYAQLNTQLNSSAVVGVSLPVLGSPERRTVMLTLLDRAISANLLYLDAIEHGLDQDPAYRTEMESFSKAILGELYERQRLVGEIEVTPEEVDAFIAENFAADAEQTEQLRAGAEATIRNQRYAERMARNRERLREGVDVTIHAENLDPAGDADRGDGILVAEIGDERITWGETKRRLTTLNNSASAQKRVESLDKLVDQRLAARKGREAGLDQDPAYQRRMAEFRRTRLLNLHREKLVQGMEPTEDELRAYYEANRDQIQIREQRRIQMVVLPTKEQAEEIKTKIESGDITIFQAAVDHSIDPNAKRTLGDFGWVTKGTGFPKLDELTFALESDTLGGPVESPAGWHLVKVTDVRDAHYTDFGDEDTRTLTRRRLLKEKMDQYVVDLRKQGDFPVTVYQDNMSRLFKEEAQWIAAKTRDMEAHPDRAEKILNEMRKIVE